jgi:hypothetical protein
MHVLLCRTSPHSVVSWGQIMAELSELLRSRAARSNQDCWAYLDMVGKDSPMYEFAV